jgi:hypothetical protein
MIATSTEAKPAEAALDIGAIKAGLDRSFRSAPRDERPYPHWTLSRMFGPVIRDALCALDFPVPELDGVSGARELHNNTRQYFDPANIARHPICHAVAEAFQAPDTVAMIAEVTGAAIDDCFLRIEYAQDADGFWLQPHTDLGVKKLTLLYYLADGEGQQDLGTDIYSDAKTWVGRSAFDPDTALMFVPSDRTWHGFEPRPIRGVRKSVIVNYVNQDWRAREQLAYPEAPVRA